MPLPPLIHGTHMRSVFILSSLLNGLDYTALLLYPLGTQLLELFSKGCYSTRVTAYGRWLIPMDALLIKEYSPGDGETAYIARRQLFTVKLI